MKKQIVLDCTLRDGGYYCNWDYSKELVEKYLKAMSLAKVDVVEIGFRQNSSKEFLGPYAFCTDDFLSTLDIPSSLEIAVMINAKEYLLKDKKSINDLLARKFAPRIKSKVSLVRLACNFEELSHIGPIIDFLVKAEYKITVQLMKCAGKTDHEIIDAVKMVSSYNGVDVLYFADSFGNYGPEDIASVVKVLKQGWSKEIGFHAHDNKGLALHNCLKAFECGVTWLDCTVLGMGRGAGNAKTELLLLELQKTSSRYFAESLFPLVLGDFAKLQQQYQWGNHLMYYISAINNIHPTFVQEILANYHFDYWQVINIINRLKDQDSSSFSQEKLEDAALGQNWDCEGTWNPQELIEGKEVLILGPGDGVKNHKDEIIRFIKRKKPIVLSLNINSQISYEYIDCYLASHPMRFLLDVDKYTNLKRPIIVPLDMLKEFTHHLPENLKIYNYGLKISSESLAVGTTTCSLPSPLVVGYALAVANSGRSSKIFVAGLDGHSVGDPRQLEMNQLLDSYYLNTSLNKVYAITPSTYRLDKCSVYDPEV